jgi:hypothetical protein
VLALAAAGVAIGTYVRRRRATPIAHGAPAAVAAVSAAAVAPPPTSPTPPSPPLAPPAPADPWAELSSAEREAFERTARDFGWS